MQLLFYLVIFEVLMLNLPHQASGSEYRNDSALYQLNYFGNRFEGPIGILTTGTGYPVSLKDTQTINSRLILNQFFMESMLSFSGERIPERVVHAKGTGAFGYFKVTHDLSDICKAKLFNGVGRITPLVARFSLVTTRPGGSDTSSEIRGFAVKFHTDEGNWDFVSINTPMFQLKDPVFFPTFSHTFHKNPTSSVEDYNARWDYLTQRPETLSMFMLIFAGRGIPDGYRHMPGYTIHTFELINNAGKRTFGRFNLLPDLGIKNLTTAQANRIMDPDFATRDLYNAIADGNFPTWTLSVQTIPEHEVSEATFDIFDVTKFWPERLYPLRPIGTLVLNENPENQFADIEQLAFDPGNLVPGIRGVDTLFEARAFTYRVANLHRLGGNFNKIRVNCPLSTVPLTYIRDGYPPVKDNGGDSPNYYPNSFHGPIPYLEDSPPEISVNTDSRVTNFDQARDLYIQMTEEEKCRLVENIVASVGNAETFLQERAVKWFKIIHEELGSRIEYSLKNKNKNSDTNQCYGEIFRK